MSTYICFKRWKCRVHQPRRQGWRNLILFFQMNYVSTTGTVHFSMVFYPSTGHCIVKMWHWHIKLMIQCNFPVLFSPVFSCFGVKDLEIQALFSFKRTLSGILTLKILAQVLWSNKEKCVLSIFGRTRNPGLNWSTYDSVHRSGNLTDICEAHNKLPEKFMESLSAHLTLSVRNEVSEGDNALERH